jgi:hypothetical protein
LKRPPAYRVIICVDLYPVDLAPGPRWHGADQQVDRYQAAVLFNQRQRAKRGAAAATKRREPLPISTF